MTLKEKVAEMEPENIGDFGGGVKDCPSSYDYLNDNAGEDNSTCIRNCEECWNREYHPKEEKPVDVKELLNDLHAIMWMGEGCQICAHCVIEQREPYMKTGCKLKDGCEPLWRGLVDEEEAPGT